MVKSLICNIYAFPFRQGKSSCARFSMVTMSSHPLLEGAQLDLLPPVPSLMTIVYTQNMARNNLGSMGAMAIAEIMQKNQTLEHLDLSGN